VPDHSRPSETVESPVRGDEDCHHSPYRDGRAAHYALGDGVFCHAIHVFQVDIVDEMLIEFSEQAKWCSCFENSGMRLYDLILRPPLGQVRLADQLEEAVGQLQVERREADIELEGRGPGPGA
jgi:hypothetical protein